MCSTKLTDILLYKKYKISDSDETQPPSDTETQPPFFECSQSNIEGQALQQPPYKNVSQSVQQDSCNPQYDKSFENFQPVQGTSRDENVEPLLASDKQSKNISGSLLDAIKKKYAYAFMSQSLQLSQTQETDDLEIAELLEKVPRIVFTTDTAVQTAPHVTNINITNIYSEDLCMSDYPLCESTQTFSTGAV